MADSSPLTSGAYTLRFLDLYARVWDLATEQEDGTRVYVSAGDGALKWLIQDPHGAGGRGARDRIRAAGRRRRGTRWREPVAHLAALGYLGPHSPSS